MKRYAAILTIVLTLSINSILTAQNKHPYASDKPIPVPVLFAEGIISTPSTFGSTFTPDGKTFYFAKYDSAAHISSIMKSSFENGAWAKPVVAGFSGGYYEGDPFISPDGSKIFYWSVRPKDGSTKTPGSANIWMAEKAGEEFTNPVFLGDKLKISNGGAPGLSAKGNLYFFTQQNGLTKKRDICKADLFNPDSVTVIVEGNINSGEHDYDSFIAPDESYIIFTSEREGGFGKGDLYISYNNNGIWSQPVNLGAGINSAGYDYCPLVSPDGNYFFFTSDRSGKGMIYYVDINALKLKNPAK